MAASQNTDTWSLKCQLQTMQADYEHLKYRLCEANQRADSAQLEVKKLHCELQVRLKKEREWHLALATKDRAITVKTEESCALQQRLTEMKIQLEETLRNVKDMNEDKQKAAQLEEDLRKKEQESADRLRRLQETQALVCEIQIKLRKLEMQNEGAERDAECCKMCKQQGEEAKQLNSEWENVVEQLWSQLKDMRHLKKKCDELEQRLIEKERELDAEKNCHCKKEGVTP